MGYYVIFIYLIYSCNLFYEVLIFILIIFYTNFLLFKDEQLLMTTDYTYTSIPVYNMDYLYAVE